MYESLFGLHEEPFSIAPDPRFLYMSKKHSEAFVLLNLGLTRGASFVLLTGEIGAGKTTVWRHFLEELPPNVDVANVVNPKLDVNALLTRVFEDLQVELPEGARTVDLIDALHGHLLLAGAQGRRTLIVIDEAQALSMEVLEQLRLLTNLDATGKKLQIMLIAQPEMRQILERPALEPLAQRIVARYHLRELSEEEANAYIAHRLHVAGLRGPLPFDSEALALIHRLCRGVPRRINVLCDRALAVATASGTRHVGSAIIARAAVHAFGEPATPAPAEAPARPAAQPWPKALALAGVAGIAVAAGVWLAPRFGALPALAWAPVFAPAAAPATAVVVAPAAAKAVAPTATVVVAPAAAKAVAPAPVPVATVAAVAPVAAPMLAPTLESAFTPVAADEVLALRALAARWGVELAAGNPCSAASQRSLMCFRTRGGLASIRQLDRPGLMRLTDDRGRVAHAQLIALRDDAAVLSMAGFEHSVPFGDLARWWRGEFTTFWRAPPGYRDGEGGASTVWLAQQLERADGGPALSDSEPALRSRIFAFQISKGLVPDGMAGPLTLMQLNRASGIDEPRLGVTSGSRPF